MQAIRDLENLKTSGVRGVLTDIDDTLTQDGRLSSATFNALHQLHDAGYKIIPVTGRSSGWAHMALSTWPIDAIVAESGGCWYTRDRAGLLQFTVADLAAQTARARLQQLCEQLIGLNPPLQFAMDNRYRCMDVAIDFNESTKHCSQLVVDRVIRSIQEAGFNARASSIHINAWSGHFDKGPSALQLIQSTFSDLADEKQWVFIGDAPNDESMFRLFSNSVVVANFLDTPQTSLSALKHHPQYITQQRYGRGFEQLVKKLLKR